MRSGSKGVSLGGQCMKNERHDITAGGSKQQEGQSSRPPQEFTNLDILKVFASLNRCKIANANCGDMN